MCDPRPVVNGFIKQAKVAERFQQFLVSAESSFAVSNIANFERFRAGSPVARVFGRSYKRRVSPGGDALSICDCASPLKQVCVGLFFEQDARKSDVKLREFE